MNILLPVFSSGKGGLEMYVLELAEELKSRGHTPYLAVPPNSYLNQKRIEKRLPGFTRDTFNYLDPVTVFKLWMKVNECGIDVIHLHDSQDYWYGGYLKLAGFKGALIATQHMRPGHKNDFLHRLIYDQFDRFMAITEDVKDLLIERCDRSDEQVDVLYHGFDMADPQEQTNSDLENLVADIDPGAFIVGVVGRIDPQKRQDLLVRALGELRDQGFNVEALIVGESIEPIGEAYEKELRESVRRNDLEDDVHFLGFQDQIKPLMASMDLLCLPSECETFGRVLVESQSVGTPVVASDAGGAPEALRDGYTGFLFDPGDVGELTENIKRFLIDEKLTKQMGSRGRKFVRERFAWDDHFDEVEKIYRATLD